MSLQSLTAAAATLRLAASISSEVAGGPAGLSIHHRTTSGNIMQRHKTEKNTSSKPSPKRPRLALRSEFLESESDTEKELMEAAQATTNQQKRKNYFDESDSDTSTDDNEGGGEDSSSEEEQHLVIDLDHQTHSNNDD